MSKKPLSDDELADLREEERERRYEPVEQRAIRESQERKYGKRPGEPGARAQYDALLSTAHFWQGVAIVLGLALFFGLLILGSVLGLDGSSDPCYIDAGGYPVCYYPDTP